MSNGYTIFDLGYDRNLVKDDGFYEPNPKTGNAVEDSVDPVFMGSGTFVGNMEIVDGYFESDNYESGTAGWRLSPTTAEFNIPVLVNELHIPDQDTTADSFHVASDADTWWGCTETDFNADNDNATSYILKDGTAKFQSATVDGYFNLTSNDLDDVDDGTSYSRILAGDVDSGSVVQSSRAAADLAPTSSGLYLTSDFLGYYDGTSPYNASGWNVYIDSSGQFKFSGDASNYIEWNGSNLNVRGSITIEGGSGISNLTDAGSLATEDTVGSSDCDATIISGGYIVTGLLTADNIQAGTLEGRTVKSTDANTRIELNAGDDAIKLYQSGNLRVAIGSGVISFLNTSGVASGDIYGLGTNQLGFDVSGSGDYYMNASEFAPQQSGRNLGHSSTYKFQHLYLSGNVYVDGNVDGVDISSHVASSSAHHTKYSDSDARDAVTGTALPGSLLSASSSYDLGSSTYPWDNAYFDSWYFPNGDVAMDYDPTDNGQIWISKNLMPSASGSYDCGSDNKTSYEHWSKVCADYILYDISHGSFQHHDDIAMMKAIGTEELKDRKSLEFVSSRSEGGESVSNTRTVWKKSDFPKEVFWNEDKGGFFNMADLQGFLIGTIKQLIDKVESLENEVQTLKT